jgi:hypothetical protein
MSQVISKIKVLTSPFPTANVSTGGVKVSVNPGNTQRVKSFNYLPNSTDISIADAVDVEILNSANNNSVLTYDSTIQKFVVQNIPRLNGGTF